MKECADVTLCRHCEGSIADILAVSPFQSDGTGSAAIAAHKTAGDVTRGLAAKKGGGCRKLVDRSVATDGNSSFLCRTDFIEAFACPVGGGAIEVVEATGQDASLSLIHI